HRANAAREAFRAIREAGCANLSLDLMWGLPGQTLEQWLEDARAAIALGPEHISAYGLTLEPGTPLAESCGDAELPSEDVQCAMYLEGIRLLEEAGLHHYEVSNFARDGFRCRHNLGYWEGRDYLGVGPAATSTIGGERWTNPEGEGWLEQVREGRRCPEREPLDRATRALELMMLRLRTVDGLPLDAYESLAGRSFLGDHGPFAHRLCAEGLARMENGVFRLTDEGMLVSNSILGELFEEEPKSAE
ncbi:MAG: coproporphyrinogen-III oxidase family protein, partial [Bilophila wadsworthia]